MSSPPPAAMVAGRDVSSPSPPKVKPVQVDHRNSRAPRSESASRNARVGGAMRGGRACRRLGYIDFREGDIPVPSPSILLLPLDAVDTGSRRKNEK